uniref:Uncharacterized protein n=1 Tax=Peronospora matthiolae TaxID=2874970 RepID=A0AAV1T537_9STRA
MQFLILVPGFVDDHGCKKVVFPAAFHSSKALLRFSVADIDVEPARKARRQDTSVQLADGLLQADRPPVRWVEPIALLLQQAHHANLPALRHTLGLPVARKRCMQSGQKLGREQFKDVVADTVNAGA